MSLGEPQSQARNTKTRARGCAMAIMSVLVSSCSADGSLNTAATTDVMKTLAVACPIVGAIQASSTPLNAYQKSALNSLALACPPNAPPTSAVIVIGDLLAAYAILRPLIK